MGYILPLPDESRNTRRVDTSLSPLPEFRPPARDQNVIAILLRKPDEPVTITPERLRTSLNDVAKFYERNSYGQIKYRFTVLPWHSDVTVNPLDHNQIDAIGNDVLTSSGIGDPNQFQTRLFVIPDYKDVKYDFIHNISIAGEGTKSNLGLPNYAWLYPKKPLEEYNPRKDAIHELAHTLGLNHRSLEGDFAIEPDYAEEYGSVAVAAPFNGENNFTAVYKMAMGWIGREQVRDVVESGLYDLTPHDKPEKPEGTLALRLRVPDTKYNFYLDAVSLDDAPSIRLHAWDEDPQSWVYDFSPDPKPYRARNQEITYTDPEHGIRIEYISAENKVRVIFKNQ